MGVAVAVKNRVLREDAYLCRYCGGPAETVDHVIPVYRWPRNGFEREPGCHSRANLIACCHSCNYFKDSLLLEETNMHILPRGTALSSEGSARMREGFRITTPYKLKHLRYMLVDQPELLNRIPLTQNLREHEQLQALLNHLRSTTQGTNT